MRLILEETNKENLLSNKNRRITIEVNYDGCTIFEMIDDVIKPALIAWGFTEKTVDDMLGLTE